uniref:NXPE C-terminal domain-containing protein n=1 Tax=Callorhinchus milii TaxID=7868 RepID=A0A4W3JWE9_CALMI
HRINPVKCFETKFPWLAKLLNCGYLVERFTPAERAEGMFLLKMIEWTNSPGARTPFMNSTDPKHSHFLILNSQNTFHIGDQLQVMVHMYDFSGHPKQYGGDYLQARIHTPELKAGSVGTVVDYQNGSYKINFTLFWSGKVEVSVILVHPSEAIQVLKWMRDEHKYKIAYQSNFRSGNIKETTKCYLCLPDGVPVCNFTDLKTGEPWFCYKPQKLHCSARISHAKLSYNTSFFIGVSEGRGQKSVVRADRRSRKMLSLTSPSGFYFQNQWMSTQCNIRRFDTSTKVTNCLRGKLVHLYGDSTMRQWFDYLDRVLPDVSKLFQFGIVPANGPSIGVDAANRIMVKYRCHGPPIGYTDVSSRQLHYIANQLDNTKGGRSTVIAITIWAHMTFLPVEAYIRRLQNIRRSIVELLSRSPDTHIIFKTANVRDLNPVRYSLFYSDWYSFHLDKVLRKMFEGINVAFVDAWEISAAHYVAHNVHPPPIIVKNEIDMFLSYLCPL